MHTLLFSLLNAHLQRGILVYPINSIRRHCIHSFNPYNHPYQSRLSWHSCVHQAGRFRVSNLCGPPYACDNNPRQKGSAGTDVDFPFRPTRKKQKKHFKLCLSRKTFLLPILQAINCHSMRASRWRHPRGTFEAGKEGTQPSTGVPRPYGDRISSSNSDPSMCINYT